MRATWIALAGTLGLLAATSAAPAQSAGPGYTAADLLSPCQEADNDSRWGAAAEAECEQYIIGFVGALEVTGGTGSAGGICPPAVNAADEIRWAFMRWVHGSYSDRKAMPASAALMATMKESFACSE